MERDSQTDRFVTQGWWQSGAGQEPQREPLEDYPEQSIMVVCNPLQRDYHTLPRLPRFQMHNKSARMVLVETEPPEVCDWRSRLQPNRRHPDYRLYVIGSERVQSGSLEPDTEEIALFTYDSRVDAWVCCSSLRDARLPPHGRTDIAIVGDGLYFGGQVRSSSSSGPGRSHNATIYAILCLLLKSSFEAVYMYTMAANSGSTCLNCASYCESSRIFMGIFAHF